jgi:predicted AlkP superfamily pyrophosphatase or phosphodiesterase
MTATEPHHILVISIDGMANFYLDDPQVHMPHLRGLIRQGVRARSVESIFPTATWAIHTSIATGVYPRKHGVLGNWVIERSAGRVGEHFGDRMWTKEESVLRETFYDVARRMGRTTASVCWPVTRGAESLDYCIPEFYEQELFDQHCTPSFWEELKSAGLPVECYGAWSKDSRRVQMQDWLTTEIGNYLIRNHRPGLMMLHFLMPDTYQHHNYTGTREVCWALEYIDERIGSLIATLKAQSLWEHTDLFVVSDHGFANTHSTAYPNILFQQNGWYDAQQPERSQVWACSNGGCGFIYVLEKDPAIHRQLVQDVGAALRELPGVAVIFEPHEFAALGLPAPGEMADRTPDYIIEGEIDCYIDHGHDSSVPYIRGGKFKGMHGYLPTHDEMKSLFVAAGKSIRPGVTLPDIRLVDIAPTIAYLLGSELSDPDGVILHEIFRASGEGGEG